MLTILKILYSRVFTFIIHSFLIILNRTFQFALYLNVSSYAYFTNLLSRYLLFDILLRHRFQIMPYGRPLSFYNHSLKEPQYGSSWLISRKWICSDIFFQRFQPYLKFVQLIAILVGKPVNV